MRDYNTVHNNEESRTGSPDKPFGAFSWQLANPPQTAIYSLAMFYHRFKALDAYWWKPGSRVNVLSELPTK